jgi:signal transduction histidine kinase
VLKRANQAFCAGQRFCPYDCQNFDTQTISTQFQILMPMQTILPIPRATVQNGLTGLAWGLARAVWLLVSLVSFMVLIVLVVFYWHRYQVAPCEEYDANCTLTAAWMQSVGFPAWLLAGLQIFGLIVPSLFWMGLGVAVAASNPRRVWLWLVSLTFMVVWYSDMNFHALRGFLEPAVFFALEGLGYGEWQDTALVQNGIALTRGALKFLADNLLFMLAFCFPTGRVSSRWAKWTMFAFFVVSFCYSFLPFRQTVLNFQNWPSPISLAFFVLLVFAWISSLIGRLRHEDALVRTQMRAIVPVMVVGGVYYFLTTLYREMIYPIIEPASLFAVKDTPHYLVFNLVTVLIEDVLILWFGLMIAKAILKQKLLDLELVFNRALLYATLAFSVSAVYIGIVGGLGTLLGSRSNTILAVIATAIIAVIFQPLLQRLQRWANQIVYGKRDDPYQAISRLGSRLENALPTDAVLPTLVETVASSLRLPYVALKLREGQSFSVGQANQRLHSFPLIAHGEAVGMLEVSPADPNTGFPTSELRLLEDLARRVAVGVQEVRLVKALQESRAALVLTREAERARIRRDLHDGLGPMLVGTTFNLEAAQNVIGHDPEKAGRLISSATDHLQSVIADVRKMIYGLRPQALEAGLTGAITQQANQIPGIQFEAHTHDLPKLPEVLEVAIYRIVSEALNNIAKHAHASHVHFELKQHEHELRLEVRDDGIGMPANPQAGIGLQSMRERAAELGGTLELERLEPGTRLHARFPMITATMITVLKSAHA